MSSNSELQPVLLRLPDLRTRFGLSRTRVYRLIKSDPTFPKPISIGKRAIAFKFSDLSAWVDAQPPAACALSVLDREEALTR